MHGPRKIGNQGVPYIHIFRFTNHENSQFQKKLGRIRVYEKRPLNRPFLQWRQM